MAEEIKTELEVGKEYRVWMTNPVSSSILPVWPAYRVAKYLGYKDLNGKINNFFLEETGKEKNYLIIREGSIEINKDIMQVSPYGLKEVINVLNKDQINNLPDEEKLGLLKILNELGEKL